mmetsp:Transcript_7764/g.16874  ORF Transcript_7764/g.16874 Transcript_7764/m.16874 type:complete len:139 (-) Transcript_7764:672-1088(-)
MGRIGLSLPLLLLFMKNSCVFCLTGTVLTNANMSYALHVACSTLCHSNQYVVFASTLKWKESLCAAIVMIGLNFTACIKHIGYLRVMYHLSSVLDRKSHALQTFRRILMGLHRTTDHINEELVLYVSESSRSIQWNCV